MTKTIMCLWKSLFRPIPLNIEPLCVVEANRLGDFPAMVGYSTPSSKYFEYDLIDAVLE